LQIRIHGRGGQGVVTAAEMLALAGFEQGRHAQAFPSFGSERTGAPVVAFCRLDTKPIRLREPVLAPDVLIVQDATLLHQVDVFQGLGPAGWVLINSTHTWAALGLPAADGAAAGRRATVPASQIARRHLGRAMPNTALLGGFAALTGELSLAAVQAAIAERFGELGKAALVAPNAAAAAEAYEWVREEIGTAASGGGRQPSAAEGAPC
jgi:pyruvate ferredoxin oxidoreductase gamma subunit